ncbi:MAG: Glu/Leu/Phe/Val dehydrogenase [Dehalococcoidia bacterium]|nr:Glu/Leu/Phe/Val dehydrogenase [Dehalococcoidia bacterium]
MLGGVRRQGRSDRRPARLSQAELQNLTRRYTSEISQIIGPDRDIPAPDLGTNAQTMAWMMDPYSIQHGYTVPGVVTGKPIALGGSEGRFEATCHGILFVLEEHLRDIGGVRGRRVAVQGFGNVGGVTAKLLAQEGAVVTHICDRETGGHLEASIDAISAFTHVQAGGTLGTWGGAGECVAPEEVLYADVDALVPAAIEGVITGANTDRVRAPLIIEGANGPITPEADDLLAARGVVVIPDILANAGGVTVSYFELVQAREYRRWTLNEVNDELRRYMVEAYRNVAGRCVMGVERCDMRKPHSGSASNASSRRSSCGGGSSPRSRQLHPSAVSHIRSG